MLTPASTGPTCFPSTPAAGAVPLAATLSILRRQFALSRSRWRSAPSRGSPAACSGPPASRYTRSVPWWDRLPVLTIAGERLELSRLRAFRRRRVVHRIRRAARDHGRRPRGECDGLGGGCCCSPPRLLACFRGMAGAPGRRGAHKLRLGQTRFIAVALLVGYLAGVGAAVAPPPPAACARRARLRRGAAR